MTRTDIGSGSGASTSAGTGTDAWVGDARRWDAYYLAILVGTLVVTWASTYPSTSGRVLTTAALVALVPWYALVGRPALVADCPPRRGVIYVAGLVPLLAVAEFYGASATTILLALCPQCFMALPYRRAIVAVVLLNLTPVLFGLHRGGGAVLVATIGACVLGIAFSIAFGRWMTRIIQQSAERAALIRDLEETRAELAAAHREAGIAAERQRLAGEIHDTIAQGCSSIVMLSQAALAQIDSDPAQARDQLKLVAQTARENLAEARALVAGLMPAELAAAGLAEALARLADRVGAESPTEATFEVSGEPRPVGATAEVVLLRVCQEALANVRKHAAATSARIVLDYADDGVRLQVTDDGAGFDPAAVNGGYGLRGMRARAADIGGTVTVTSAPDRGTNVVIRVPA